MESSINALAKYRFESSQEALADAKLMFENGRYKMSYICNNLMRLKISWLIL